MAAYESLTTEQKAAIQSFANNLRAFGGELARLGNHAAAIRDSYDAHISALNALIDANAVIPNTSGFAGVDSLTKEELAALYLLVKDFLTDLSSYTGGLNTAVIRQKLAQAAGVANVIG